MIWSFLNDDATVDVVDDFQFLLFRFFSTKFHLGSSLRLVMLEVPSPSYAGESIELSCIYDLEQDKLYSVKWYKNDVEFYR